MKCPSPDPIVLHIFTTYSLSNLVYKCSRLTASSDLSFSYGVPFTCANLCAFLLLMCFMSNYLLGLARDTNSRGKVLLPLHQGHVTQQPNLWAFTPETRELAVREGLIQHLWGRGLPRPLHVRGAQAPAGIKIFPSLKLLLPYLQSTRHPSWMEKLHSVIL